MGNLNDNNLYTNQENTWAAQIAYCNINENVIAQETVEVPTQEENVAEYMIIFMNCFREVTQLINAA